MDKNKVQVKFRLTESENQLFREQVEKSGLSQQDYLRLKALGIEIEEVPKSEAHLIKERMDTYEALLKKILETEKEK